MDCVSLVNERQAATDCHLFFLGFWCVVFGVFDHTGLLYSFTEYLCFPVVLQKQIRQLNLPSVIKTAAHD